MKKYIKSKFTFRDKEFRDFKGMKAEAYFSLKNEEHDNGFEVSDDLIIKQYEFIKQERRILCRVIYDYFEMLKEDFERKQLNIFK